MSLTEAIKSGQLDDYASGYQRNPNALIDGMAVDLEVLAGEACTRCGHVGLSPRYFHKPGSLRAFAMCRACGLGEEF